MSKEITGWSVSSVGQRSAFILLHVLVKNSRCAGLKLTSPGQTILPLAKIYSFYLFFSTELSYIIFGIKLFQSLPFKQFVINWLRKGSIHANMRHSTGNKLKTSLYKYSKIIATLLYLRKSQDNMKLEFPEKLKIKSWLISSLRPRNFEAPQRSVKIKI